MTDDDMARAPARLFKYLPRSRVDVIQNLRIRFTPLLATNDIFEIRRTFKKLVGPKFHQLLAQQALELDPEATMIEELKKTFGYGDEQARSAAKTLLTQKYGPDYNMALQKEVGDLAKLVVPRLNRADNIEQVLRNVGGQLVALSLSEDQYNSAMWTHYAEQGQGFVLEFDTNNSFFSKSPKTGKTRGLQKIEYFDGQIEEVMDAPNKALASKTTNWAYEKEWRLVLRPEEADVELPGSPDPIHLFNIPPQCISQVLLGYRADVKLLGDVQAFAAASIPSAKIKKLIANRFAGTFSEEDV